MAEEKKQVIGRVKLLEVRGSFLQIWEPKAIQSKEGGNSPPKFSANGLIKKTADGKSSPLKGVYMGKTMPIMDALRAAKLDAIAKKLGMEEAKKLKIKAQHYCVKDGDDENYDGYADHFFISTNNTERPKIIGRDKRPLTSADGILYSGCFINLIATLWYQKAGTKDGNPVPHAVYGSLEAIQFVRKGEAFGAAPVDVDSDFDDITDGDDEIDSDSDTGDEEGEDDVL